MLNVLVLLFVVSAVSSFSKFVSMNDADDCKDENNLLIPTNGDDEVFVNAWKLSKPYRKGPLEGGCQMSFMSYGNYGISYVFLGNSSKNYINSAGTYLNIYKDSVAIGDPVVVYRAGDEFPNTTQHLDAFITVQLVNDGGRDFDFSLHIQSTDPPFEDPTDLFSDHFTTVVVPVGLSLMAVVCVGVAIFLIYRWRKSRATAQMLRMEETPTSFNTSFDNRMYQPPAPPSYAMEADQPAKTFTTDNPSTGQS